MVHETSLQWTSADAFDVLEMLLDDDEWLDAEFAAIINASGFGERTVDVRDRFIDHDQNANGRSPDATRRSSEGVHSSTWSRVRSPPEV